MSGPERRRASSRWGGPVAIATAKRIATFESAGKRTLRTCALLLACLLVPSGLVAQTEADRESVNRVVQELLRDAGEYSTEIPHIPGDWSLVIARFAKGDSREIAIPAKVGEMYSVVGAAESSGTDMNICAFGPAGDPVDCDTREEYHPYVGFVAKTEGTYRIVMTAASVEGEGTSFAGMAVFVEAPMREMNGEGARK